MLFVDANSKSKTFFIVIKLAKLLRNNNYPVFFDKERNMNTNNLFQLSLPDGWRETTVYTFEGPHDSGVQHNLVVVVNHDLPRKTVLEEWAKAQFEATCGVMPGFEMIQEHLITLSSGLPSYEIVYKYVPADEIILFQKQMFVIVKDNGVIFTATFSKLTLQTVAIEVDEIIASLRLLDPITDEELRRELA